MTGPSSSCGHCHHGSRFGQNVGWSPSERRWEPCASVENPTGPAVQPLSTFADQIGAAAGVPARPFPCTECGGAEPTGDGAGVVHHWTCSLRPSQVVAVQGGLL